MTRGVVRRWSLTFNIHKKLLRPTSAKHAKCKKIFLLLAKKSDLNAKPEHCADGSFYIDSTHISFILGSIFVDECRLLPCVYLCIILTFKYQLFVSY